jgi:hypothetical protein
MKCPFCGVEFHANRQPNNLGQDPEGRYWAVTPRTCPACNRVNLHMERIEDPNRIMLDAVVMESTLIWPRSSPRPPAPPEVPAQYAEDYNEAALVLADSPKASAALSRRCMQNILRDEEGVNPGNLSAEIQEAINNGNLASHVEVQLDAVREIGNLAAHPTKD